MRTFKDTENREWRLKIGLATARHLKEQTGGRIDCIEQGAGGHGHNLFSELAADIGLLGQVLWLLCETQAAERGISELEFADAFDLDTLGAAQNTLVEAIIDFFPSRSRQLLREGMTTAQNVADEMTAAAEANARAIMNSPEMRETMAAAIRGKPSMNSLGS